MFQCLASCVCMLGPISGRIPTGVGLLGNKVLRLTNGDSFIQSVFHQPCLLFTSYPSFLRPCITLRLNLRITNLVQTDLNVKGFLCLNIMLLYFCTNKVSQVQSTNVDLCE